MIEHNKPYIDIKNFCKILNHILEEKWICYGKISKLVEENLSNFILDNKKFARLVINGTSALYLALKALGIKKGDEVIVPTYSCTALLNAIFMANAVPKVCDISLTNLSLTREIVSNNLTKRTRAVIVVHTFGIPCEITPLKEINIPIIEDCSQSLGSRFIDKTLTGSKGDVSIFSFYATKFITGGLGGAILTKNSNMLSYIDDYINFDMPDTYKPRFNFVISDINSSLILANFLEINKLLKRRKQMAMHFLSKIHQKEYVRYNLLPGVNHFRFLLKFNSLDHLLKCQSKFFNAGIQTIIPIKKGELLHRYLNLPDDLYPNAEFISDRLLSIPIHFSLSEQDINTIREVIYDCISTPASI